MTSKMLRILAKEYSGMAAQAFGDAADEIDKLRDTLMAADDDIREHLQVARYNLTGMMHTGDQCPIPKTPTLIHAAGIAASDRVRARITETLRSSTSPAKIGAGAF